MILIFTKLNVAYGLKTMQTKPTWKKQSVQLRLTLKFTLKNGGFSDCKIAVDCSMQTILERISIWKKCQKNWTNFCKLKLFIKFISLIWDGNKVALGAWSVTISWVYDLVDYMICNLNKLEKNYNNLHQPENQLLLKSIFDVAF